MDQWWKDLIARKMAHDSRLAAAVQFEGQVMGALDHAVTSSWMAAYQLGGSNADALFERLYARKKREILEQAERVRSGDDGKEVT